MFDISLLYELKKGNREAFNGVFRYYYPRIMAYTASIVKKKAAEDIVQDVIPTGHNFWLISSKSDTDNVRKKWRDWLIENDKI